MGGEEQNPDEHHYLRDGTKKGVNGKIKTTAKGMEDRALVEVRRGLFTWSTSHSWEFFLNVSQSVFSDGGKYENK